ncbi:hypothetical protein V7128_00930 [Neobacillus vireti]|uniref:hypothetical protein n=1 Tax=Neobacillus vireti TaxID=220686 RepID=UPI0030005430
MKKNLSVLFVLMLFFGIATSANAASAPGGSAAYRHGGFLNGHDHAGVMKNSTTVYEIAGYSSDSVKETSLTNFKAGETYYGTYKLKSGLTSTQRDAIITTAEALEQDTGLTYTMYDMINWDSYTGSYINVYNITDIRCDGVVEYAYEWNNYWVWGRTDTTTQSGTPTNFDVSYVTYAKQHANLGSDEPWIEVSPKVQRGASTCYTCTPSKYTKLTKE